MKKTLHLIFLLLLLLSWCVTPIAVSAVQPDASLTVEAGCHSLRAQVPLGGSEKKVDHAKAVILYELNTDTLLYAYNPDMQINPTGLVKLLTALVAIEKGNLDDQVTAYSSTLYSVAMGAVSANIKPGEIMSLRDLLYCMMVASANDAAAVIAAHIGGNQAGFVEMLNAKAQELGCTGTNIVNVHGLAANNQYSTARDLAIITEAALENEIFTEMFTAKTYTVPATNKSEARVLHTTNYMMDDAVIQTQVDSRVTGGKPAAATNTDRSMACTAEVGTSRYLCIVMSSTAEVSEDGLSITRWTLFEEVSFLLDFGFANFAVRQIVDKNQSSYQYFVSGGDSDAVLRPSESISVVLPLNFSQDDLHFEHVVDANSLQAPLEKGSVLGQLQIRYNSVYIGVCQLVAMNRVALAGSGIAQADRIVFQEKEEERFDWRPVFIWMGVIVAGAVVLCILVLVVLHVLRNARLRAVHRRRARERRRTRR